MARIFTKFVDHKTLDQQLEQSKGVRRRNVKEKTDSVNECFGTSPSRRPNEMHLA